MGVDISMIDFKKNCVTLKNGASFQYKHFVYSGTMADWKNSNYDPYLEKSLAASHKFIYGDSDFKNIEHLFRRSLGTIVFIIPEGRHFGCKFDIT